MQKSELPTIESMENRLNHYQLECNASCDCKDALFSCVHSKIHLKTILLMCNILCYENIFTKSDVAIFCSSEF